MAEDLNSKLQKKEIVKIAGRNLKTKANIVASQRVLGISYFNLCITIKREYSSLHAQSEIDLREEITDIVK